MYALKPNVKRGHSLSTTTLREFGGGWNVVDSDLNMKPKYAPLADNMSVSENGIMSVRGGHRLFSDVPPKVGLIGMIVTGCVYFQDRIITAINSGRILSVDGAGNAIAIWTPTIASGASVPAWVAGANLVTFTVFSNKLIACDGVNKPLEIDTLATPTVRYLADAGTSSNANVPVAVYCTTVGEYCVMAGDPQHLDRVWISQRGASGTWPGDPSTDAVYVDLGKRVNITNQIIRGLSTYKDMLVVVFDNCVVLMTLGIYDADGAHTPQVADIVQGVGSMSHRALANIGIDLLIANVTGVASLARTTEARTVEPDHISKLIDPELVPRLSRQTTAQLLYDVWAVFDDAEDRYILALPNFKHGQAVRLPTNPVLLDPRGSGLVIYTMPDHGLDEDDDVIVSNVVPDPASPFSTHLNGDWRVHSVIDRDRFVIDYSAFSGGIDPLHVVLGGSNVMVTYQRTESTMYVLHQVRDAKKRAWTRWRGFNMRAACMSDQKRLFMYDVDGKLWLMDGPLNRYTLDDATGLKKGIWFKWDLPWGDFGARKGVKRVRYIAADAQGGSAFTVTAFVDGYLTDEFGQPDPAISIEMGGIDAPGWGDGDQRYGGKRPSRDARLYDFPMRFEIVKLRLSGLSTAGLSVVSLSMMYQTGDVRM